MDRDKVVHDPVHGSIPLGGLFLDLTDRHEVQRLRSVKQLGLAYLVFPGANHTRFEHSLGTYHLSGRMADAIRLDEHERETVRVAGLLHDICHPPFSHTLEAFMESASGLDHMELARALITGKVRNRTSMFDELFDGVGPMGDLIEAEGISAEEVCDLIEYPESRMSGLDMFAEKHSYFPSKDYAHQIIHGPVDADQMDYLMRDAHYTGMTHGAIDCERLINTMRVHNDRIVIRRGGITAAEGLMVSRSLMYTSVYFHETVKIIERMLTKAVAESGMDLTDLYLWTDSDLTQKLLESGGRAATNMKRILCRDIDKKALVVYNDRKNDDLANIMLQYTGPGGREQLEQEVADQAGVDVFNVGALVTRRSNIRSSIKIGKTDVAILDDDDRVRNLASFSPIAHSLQARDTCSWSVLVSAPAQYREAVGKAAKKILGISL